MGGDDAPVCPRHAGEVRMKLRTLHSDQASPGEVLGVYVCPDCGYERRLPISRPGGEETGGLAPMGAG